VVTQAVNACARMNLQPIMSYNCHWNEEVIAQFYVTLYANRGKKEFQWMLQGQRFSVTYNQFATILGFFAKDLKRPKTHDENMLEDREMHYMHDSAYGKGYVWDSLWTYSILHDDQSTSQVHCLSQRWQLRQDLQYVKDFAC